MTATTANAAATKAFMLRNFSSHVDGSDGLLNHTSMAEEAAYALNLYKGDDIPEAVFELALKVGEVLERNGSVRRDTF